MNLSWVDENRLMPDEQAVYKIIKGRDYISQGTPSYHSIKISELRTIMRNTFGLDLVRERNETGHYKYRIVKKYVRSVRKERRAIAKIQTLPCMLPKKSIAHCGHARSCYLSGHCSAAGYGL